MKLKSVEGVRNLYRDEDTGTYWLRTYNENGKRTKRRIYGFTLQQAIEEARFAAVSKAMTLTEVAQVWIGLGCPVVTTPRSEHYVAQSKLLLRVPLDLWGDRPIRSIAFQDVDTYPAIRRGLIRKDGCTGNRMIDRELTMLSCLWQWAARKGWVQTNPFHGREKAQKAHEVVHCTARAPVNADQVHAIAAKLMEDRKSEVYGWLWLWICLTGCRRHELVSLPWDPPVVGQDYPAGYLTDAEFVINRAKQTITAKLTALPLHPAAREMAAAFRHWHATRWPYKKHWFPSTTDTHIFPTALNRRIEWACEQLGFRHISPHGGRAFACAALRSTGLDDRFVADALGHASVKMVEAVYGGRISARITSWLPTNGTAAWARWIPAAAENVVAVA